MLIHALILVQRLTSKGAVESRFGEERGKTARRHGVWVGEDNDGGCCGLASIINDVWQCYPRGGP